MREIHPYATDSDERDRWAIFIGVVAVLAGYALHALIEPHRQDAPEWLWWVEIPGPIALYFTLRRFMDDHGWAWSPLHRFRLVRIPNLTGRWDGTLRTSHDEMGQDYPCQILIRQTWTRIAVVLTTATSRSENLVAGVLINGVDEALLVYEFVNQPKMEAPKTMEMHRGHTTLRLEHRPDGDALVGEYYSGRGRLNTGTINVKRIT
jgi:SMODS-associating 2TM, beta-strand rich effector domain